MPKPFALDRKVGSSPPDFRGEQRAAIAPPNPIIANAARNTIPAVSGNGDHYAIDNPFIACITVSTVMRSLQRCQTHTPKS